MRSQHSNRPRMAVSCKLLHATGTHPPRSAHAAQDEIGGAGVPKSALRSTSEYAFKLTRPGEKERNPSQQAAFERLLKK